MAKAKAKASKKKPRSAAQKAATAKMLAANKRKAKATAPAKKSKPRKAKKAASRKAAVTKHAAPKRAAKKSKQSTGRKPMKKHSNYKARAKGAVKNAVELMKGGAIAGGAALGADVVMGYLPLPDKLKTGAGNAAVRLALGIGAGMAAEHVPGLKKHGRDIAIGIIATTVRDAARPIIQAKLPSLKLGEIADISEMFDDSDDTAALSSLAEMIDEDASSGRLIEGMGEQLDDQYVGGLAGDMAIFRS